MLLYIILQHKTFHVPSATPMSPPQQNFEISYGSDKFWVLPSSWLFVIDSNLTITHFRLIKYKSVYIMRALRQRKPNSKPTRTTTRCGESRRSSTQRSKDRRMRYTRILQSTLMWKVNKSWETKYFRNRKDQTTRIPTSEEAEIPCTSQGAEGSNSNFCNSNFCTSHYTTEIETESADPEIKKEAE